MKVRRAQTPPAKLAALHHPRPALRRTRLQSPSIQRIPQTVGHAYWGQFRNIEVLLASVLHPLRLHAQPDFDHESRLLWQLAAAIGVWIGKLAG